MRLRKGFCLLCALVLTVGSALPVFAAEAVDFKKQAQGLPGLDTVKKLSAAEQQALYEQIDGIWENGFYNQSEQVQKELENTPQFEALKAITEYFNEAQVSPLQWVDCGQLRLSGEELKDGEDYAYDATAKELVIKGSKPVTVTNLKAGEASGDTIRTTAEASVTLKDVTIQAESGKSALTAENVLKLSLVGSNSLTAQDREAISGAEVITVSGIGSLRVQGGQGSSGIGTKKLAVAGGTLVVRGGDGTPGTEEAKGGNGGKAIDANTVTVTGGSLNLTGGQPGTDGGKGAGEAGESITVVNNDKPLTQTQVTLKDGADQPVAGTAVTALSLTPEESYGLTGVVTDETGTVYLYLPQDTKATAVAIGSATYTGDPITAGETGVLTLAAAGTDTKSDTNTNTNTNTDTNTNTNTNTNTGTNTGTNAGTNAEPEPAPKADQSPPRDLQCTAQTPSSVTLQEVQGVGTTYYAYGATPEKPDIDWTTSNTFTGLTPGKTYYFFAYFGGNDKTKDSPVSNALAVTLQKGMTAMDVDVQGLEKTYDGKSASPSVSIPSGATIRFRETDSGAYELTSIPTYTNAGTYKVYYQVTQQGCEDVSGMVTVKINPATPTATIKDLTVTHDGKTHPMDGIQVQGVNGETYKGGIIYTYFTDEALTKGQTTTPPSAVGTYYVRAYIPAGGNYTDAVSNIAKLVIKKSDTSNNSNTTKPTTGGNTTTTHTTGKTYTVTASAGSGGTITQSGKVSVQSGKSASFTIVADKNFEVADVKVDGKSMGSVGVYTFTDVKADHTIEATFRRTVAETTAPTTAPTTVPTTAPTTVPTTETVPMTTEEAQKPTKKKGIPIIVPILLVVLAGCAIGGAVFVYRKYGEEGEYSE